LATKLDKIIIDEAHRIANLSGTEKMLAYLAFGSFIAGRGIVILNELNARGGLDDQGAIDAAKRHDAESADAWKALQAQIAAGT
jgi:hypothetical protein